MKRFLTDISIDSNEIKNFVVDKRATTPLITEIEVGQLFYDESDNTLKYKSDNVFINVRNNELISGNNIQITQDNFEYTISTIDSPSFENVTVSGTASINELIVDDTIILDYVKKNNITITEDYIANVRDGLIIADTENNDINITLPIIEGGEFKISKISDRNIITVDSENGLINNDTELKILFKNSTATIRCDGVNFYLI